MTSLKKYPVLIFLLISCSVLRSQSSGYTFCDWDKITFAEDTKVEEGDTCIIFASTRNYFPSKTEFFDYDLDTSGILHYMNVYFKGNKWYAVPRKDLEDALATSGEKKDIVVYGEGMGKDFTANVDRATRLTRLYDVRTIMFDWPTYRPYLTGGKNYYTAKRESKKVSRSLVKLFKDLQSARNNGKTEGSRLTLLLHSLGNRLIKEAVVNDYLDLKTKLFNNILLNAPCVKMRYHRLWLEKLNIQENIYITRNNHDRTLLLAQIAGFSKQLGMYSRWRKAENATYLNFSKILSVQHNYFLMKNVLRAHPGLKEMYADIFHGKKLSFEDNKRYRVRKKGRVIDLMRPKTPNDIDLGINLSM
jgi:hypothetical protein